jgi:hypothetical protein
MVESTFNTKLRNPGVRLGSHWVSPRAVSWVWGCRLPSLVVLSSISRRLFQEPCMLRGHLAGSFPPILHPSPPIFKPFFPLYVPHKAKQNKTKGTLYRRQVTSAPAVLYSLPSPTSGAGLLTTHHIATATPPLRLQQPAPKPSIIPSDSDSQHSFTYLCEFPESST